MHSGIGADRERLAVLRPRLPHGAKLPGQVHVLCPDGELGLDLPADLRILREHLEARASADEDGDYKAWVTPWTRRIRAAALKTVEGDKPQAVPILGVARPASMLWLPLWGEDWPLVEKALEAAFPADLLSRDIEPLERIDLDKLRAETRAAAAKENSG